MLDASRIKLLLAPLDPTAALLAVQREQFSAQRPEVLAGMVDVDDPDGAGEVDVAQIPDPGRSVANDNLALGAVQATLPGFVIDALPKRGGVLDGTGVGGRVRDRVAGGLQRRAPFA